MFEDPTGIKYVGISARKTSNYYSTAVRMEHGEGKKDFPPERNESV